MVETLFEKSALLVSPGECEDLYKQHRQAEEVKSKPAPTVHYKSCKLYIVEIKSHLKVAKCSNIKN